MHTFTQDTTLAKHYSLSGGINTYQGASKRGEKYLNAAQWIAKHLHAQTTFDERQPHSFWLVDVGALQPNYQSWRWINAVPLDLHKRHRAVLEIDFLKVELSTIWRYASKQQRRELRRIELAAQVSKRSRRRSNINDNDTDHANNDDDNDDDERLVGHEDKQQRNDEDDDNELVEENNDVNFENDNDNAEDENEDDDESSEMDYNVDADAQVRNKLFALSKTLIACFDRLS